MSISRRNFLKIATGVAVSMGAGWSVLPEVEAARSTTKALNKINEKRLLTTLKNDIWNAHLSTYGETFVNDSHFRNLNRYVVKRVLQLYQDKKVIDDFQVVCDERNNYPSIIDSNDFCLSAWIKHRYTDEIVLFKIGYSDESVGNS